MFKTNKKLSQKGIEKGLCMLYNIFEQKNVYY